MVLNTQKIYLHNDLPFLPEIMKIKNVEKLIANLYDKTEFYMSIRNIKQALNHQKSSNFAILRNTNLDCILLHKF